MIRHVLRLGGLLVALSVGAATAEAQPRSRTSAAAMCDGYPRAPIGTVEGLCAGLVADAREGGPRMPRVLLQTADAWLVTDLGGWDAGHGAVWRLHVAPGRTARWTRLLSGLNMPHPIARGPDGAVYVGEMSRIVRFDPDAADPQATVTPVVDELPDNRLHENRHPLSMFVFDGNGDMIVNVGAPTDQCPPPAAARVCPEAEGAAADASLRRYAYLGEGRWSAEFTTIARGLRNSLALARHRSGTLLQAENSIDFRNADRPFEELNVIEEGRQYGWPYCTDMRTPTPAWRNRVRDCGADYQPPALLLPPHAAPLAVTYYDGDLLPQLRGRLLMTWHGYRPTGGRVVAYAVGERGVPEATPGARYAVYPRGSRPYPAGAPAVEPLVLTPGWGAAPGRPMGAPVGVTVARDGAIWVADDRNRAIVRLAPDRPEG